MKAIRTRLIYFLLPIALLAGGIVLVGNTNSREELWLAHMSEHLTTLNLSAPAGLNFSGDRTPVQDFDVQERFEKELVRNVYYHSSTIMTLKRANRYKDKITKILRQQGVPEDFFYLAVAESHLTNAISPAGAKGFWQFMRSAGTQFGLTINKNVDERYHPIKATYAACRYLKAAHKKFGNWTLVAASYNMGMAGVQNALDKQKVDNYYDLYLNQETAAYVFRILALKTILENPERYGFNLSNNMLYHPIRTKSIKVDSSIGDLVEFAKANETTYKMLKVMNPWLREEGLTVAPGSSFSIEIPYVENLQVDELVVKDSIAIDTMALPGLDSVLTDSVIVPIDSAVKE